MGADVALAWSQARSEPSATASAAIVLTRRNECTICLLVFRQVQLFTRALAGGPAACSPPPHKEIRGEAGGLRYPGHRGNLGHPPPAHFLPGWRRRDTNRLSLFPPDAR